MTKGQACLVRNELRRQMRVILDTGMNGSLSIPCSTVKAVGSLAERGLYVGFLLATSIHKAF